MKAVTDDSCVDEVVADFRALHVYELPRIITTRVIVTEEYAAWVRAQTSGVGAW